MTETKEGLVKVYVDLPGDTGAGGESFWAKPVEPDLYELRNSPWYAFDLHFGDVVRAVPNQPGEKPRIRKVVRRSGHKTLRVVFPKETPEAEQLALLDELKPYGASYERAHAYFLAVDVLPEGDYQKVCDLLWAWENAGKLEYETGTK
jgi:Domain of unknown function (DUF4265)